MPTFPAAGPVPVVVDVPFGNLHVVAGEVRLGARHRGDAR